MDSPIRDAPLQPCNWRAPSYRQLECLAWVHEGKSATDIGVILGISSRTVEDHLRRACDLLGVRSRVQAVVRARELGLLQPTDRNLRPADSWPAARPARSIRKLTD